MDNRAENQAQFQLIIGLNVQYIEIEIGGLNKEFQSYNKAMCVGNTLTNLKM